MSDTAIQLCWLLGCAAAIWFAAHFPIEERRNAFDLAVAVLANWLFVQMTYTDFGPQYALGHIGLHYQARVLWGAADFLLGLYAICQPNRSWINWSILAGVMMQEVFHDMRNYGLTDSETYLHQLDAVLGVILALFLLGGWKGVVDGVRDRIGSRRHFHGSFRPASAQAKKRR